MDAEKESSPTRSDNNIQGLQNEPDRQLGSLRDVIDTIRRDGGKPSVESIATHLSSMHSEERAPVLLALQRTRRNLYVQRQANDTREKLPIHAKTITPIRTLKVQRQKIEGFGYDFGQVRVHHDETETAHALKARAFTVGQDIVFGSGQYSPRSADGRKLLAHEFLKQD